MRDVYYTYIKENKLNDILSNIYELSYTQKLKILKELKKDFNTKILCQALNEFDIKYIKKNRVQLKIIYNTLKGICQRDKLKVEVK